MCILFVQFHIVKHEEDPSCIPDLRRFTGACLFLPSSAPFLRSDRATLVRRSLLTVGRDAKLALTHVEFGNLLILLYFEAGH